MFLVYKNKSYMGTVFAEDYGTACRRAALLWGDDLDVAEVY
jgi:hypothetical protein